MTSGGGLLEVKPRNSPESGLKVLEVSDSNLAAPSSTTTLQDVAAAPNAASHPAVRPSLDSRASSSKNPQDLFEEEEEAANSTAVGRFFGRFRKSRASSPSVDLSHQDMKLSENDVSFLDQVPTFTAPKDAKPERGWVTC